MGLILSILIVCVGFVEVLTLCRNFSRTFVSTSTQTTLEDISSRYRRELRKTLTIEPSEDIECLLENADLLGNSMESQACRRSSSPYPLPVPRNSISSEFYTNSIVKLDEERSRSCTPEKYVDVVTESQHNNQTYWNITNLAVPKSKSRSASPSTSRKSRNNKSASPSLLRRDKNSDGSSKSEGEPFWVKQ